MYSLETCPTIEDAFYEMDKYIDEQKKAKQASSYPGFRSDAQKYKYGGPAGQRWKANYGSWD